MYEYITDKDLQTYIRQDLLDKFASTQDELNVFIQKAEKTAVEQVKSKMNDRYDLTQIFVQIQDYDETKPFITGDYVCFENEVYLATSDNSGSVPSESPDVWTQSDPRFSLLISIIIDMTLYHLHKRINPRKVPELRTNAYNEAIKWLNDIRNNKENPNFPLLESGSQYIPWGSNPKRDNYF